jgi:hypothetical protein
MLGLDSKKVMLAEVGIEVILGKSSKTHGIPV